MLDPRTLGGKSKPADRCSAQGGEGLPRLCRVVSACFVFGGGLDLAGL